MSTFRYDLHSGTKVPLVETDDIARGAITPEKLDNRVLEKLITTNGATTIGPDGYWYVDGEKTDIKAQGEQGEKGDPGIDGKDGERGENGEKGDTGAQGPKGDKGEDGRNTQMRLSDDGQTIETSVDGVTWYPFVPNFNRLRILAYLDDKKKLPASAELGAIYGVYDAQKNAGRPDDDKVYDLYINVVTGWNLDSAIMKVYSYDTELPSSAADGTSVVVPVTLGKEKVDGYKVYKYNAANNGWVMVLNTAEIYASKDDIVIHGDNVYALVQGTAIAEQRVKEETFVSKQDYSRITNNTGNALMLIIVQEGNRIFHSIGNGTYMVPNNCEVYLVNDHDISDVVVGGVKVTELEYMPEGIYPYYVLTRQSLGDIYITTEGNDIETGDKEGVVVETKTTTLLTFTNTYELYKRQVGWVYFGDNQGIHYQLVQDVNEGTENNVLSGASVKKEVIPLHLKNKYTNILNLLYNSSVEYNYDKTKAIETKIATITAGQVLMEDGTISSFSDINCVSELIESDSSMSRLKVVSIPKCSSYVKGFATIAFYYKNEESYELLYSTNIALPSISFVIPNNIAVRLSGDVKEISNKIIIDTIKTSDFVPISEWTKEYQFKQFDKIVNLFKFYAETEIAPIATNENQFIDTATNIIPLEDDKWSVYIYDISQMRGSCLYLSTPVIDKLSLPITKYGFGSTDSFIDFPFYHSLERYDEPKTYIYIPEDNNVNYLFVTVREEAALFKTRYSTSSISEELSIIDDIEDAFIDAKGKVFRNFGDKAYHLAFYSLDGYSKDKIYLTGNFSSGIETCIVGLTSSVDAETVEVLKTSKGEGNAFDESIKLPENFKDYKYIVVAYNIEPKLTISSSKKETNTNIVEHKILDCDVLICPIYGQSLAVGGEAYPVVTKSIKYPKLQVSENLTTNALPSNTEKASYGLAEGIIKFYAQHYGISTDSIKTKIFSFVSGKAGASITAHKKGTDGYTNLINTITTAYNKATQDGLTCKVAPIAWIQGEADYQNNYTQNWKADVIQLQKDLDTDIKVITKQSEDIKLMLYQTSWAAQYGYVDVLKAQTELIQENSNFIALTPLYIMDYYHSSNGEYIHINGYGQKLLGYYCAKTILYNILGFNSKGVSPISIEYNKNTITIAVNSTSNSITIDENYVRKSNNTGFSVRNNSKVEILQSVEVYTNKILLICSENINSGYVVSYAVQNGTDETGRINGSRGNIRDTDIEFIAEVGEYKIPLCNWLYAFEKTL